jgi:NADP-dependent 3-hydroxy acid dehydrogenase YdfG
MTGKLTGKVAIVTGASSGIGEATALALATEGAKVAIVARRENLLKNLNKRIQAMGGEALIIVTDVSDEAQVRQMVEKTQSTWGQIDILINNAGVMLSGEIDGSDTEDWRRMMNLNVMGVLYNIHAVLPWMKAQGAGYIINVSSVAGRWIKGGLGVYCATKWAVNVLSEALRQEVCKHNIRVMSIEPGPVDTELTQNITNSAAKAWTTEYYQSMKTLESQDIANAIMYALTQPSHVNINEILIRPTEQEA